MRATFGIARQEKRDGGRIGCQQGFVDPRCCCTPDITDIDAEFVLVLGNQFDKEFLEPFPLAAQNALQHQHCALVPAKGMNHAIGNIHQVGCRFLLLQRHKADLNGRTLPDIHTFL